MNSNVPLVLTEQFASGKYRTVWRHPLDPALCIKISVPSPGKDDNANEHHYLNHLAARGVQSRHLPRTYGWVNTDRGRGLVTDLIRTADGKPAPDLRSALRSGLMDETKAIRLTHEVLDWATENGVIVLDARPQNFVIASDGSSEWLVLIDGLGTYNLNAPPYRLACAFRPYEYWRARKKIQVRRKIMEEKIRQIANQKIPR